MFNRFNRVFNDTSSNTLPLQTVGLLSSLIFLINYTFEVLVHHDLYTTQHALIGLLQEILAIWALIELVIMYKHHAAIPLKHLTIALVVQWFVGTLRYTLHFSNDLLPAQDSYIKNHFEFGIATLFVPIYLFVFLTISKLLINAFSYTERLRANLLEEQIIRVKRTEEALRESEARYRLIADRVDDVIWTITPSKHVSYISPSVEKMIGFSAQEISNRPLSDFLTDASRMVFDKLFEKALDVIHNHSAIPAFREELEHCRKDGSTVWAEVNLSLLDNHDGRFFGFVGVTRDITAHRQQEQKLRTAQALAEQANRAKTDFISNISHEIRTPMNAIIGLSEPTLETELSPQQTSHLKTIRNSAHRLLRLINDILDLAKVEAGHLSLHPDWFSLSELLNELNDLLNFSFEQKGIVLTLQIDPNIPDCINADDLRIRQVLINLLGNALKFTEHGSATLRVSGEAVDSDLLDLCFRITDTGIGMTPDQLAHLFHRFEQADATISRRYGGTGLGLAISKRLVELMGGQIMVESQEGVGSSFSFTIRVKRGALDCSEQGSIARITTPPQQKVPVQHHTISKPLIINTQELNALLNHLESLLAANMLEAQQVSAAIEHRLTNSELSSHFLPIFQDILDLKFLEAATELVHFRALLSD